MKKLLLLTLVAFSFGLNAQNLSITELGRYTDGREDALEIVAYDSATARMFITNAASDSIDIIDIAMPGTPVHMGGIDISTYGGGVNSIANVGNGYLAAAIEAPVKQDSGTVVFFDVNGTFISQVTVGALPDMVTVTPDGSKVLVANEGEPDDAYVVDPEGSVAIIDISGGVASVSNADVNILRLTGAPASISGGLQKPNTPWANDLEPEYIAVDASSSTAAVVCQEANVLVIVDLTTESISAYKGLGFKDHSLSGNGLDVSNQDNGINIQNWNVKGAYQPDAIAAYAVGGNTYFLTANEGDARDYNGYSSEVRIDDLTLDATAFPNASTLQEDSVLGRLKTFTADVIGDTDNDGDVDELYSYGARSFSIWDASGNLVWDSGDDFEQYIAANHPSFFNCNDGLAANADSRSDDKGPEPEAVVAGKIGSRWYAFVGLERQGGIMVYDVTDPNAPMFETYVNTFQNDGTSIDVAPEGLVFVPAANSHTQNNLLLVSNEVSGTTAIYEVDDLLVGFEEVEAVSMLQVFPNPTLNGVQVKLDSKLAAGSSYQVAGVMGDVLREGNVSGQQFSLDLSSFPNGIYFLSVRDASNGRILTTPVVKH